MYKGALTITYECLEEILNLPKGVHITGVCYDKENDLRQITTFTLVSNKETEYTYNKIEGSKMINNIYKKKVNNNENL